MGFGLIRMNRGLLCSRLCAFINVRIVLHMPMEMYIAFQSFVAIKDGFSQLVLSDYESETHALKLQLVIGGG